jgi:hypothetical protein
MEYLNGLYRYELTIIDIPLCYINAFIIGLKPGVGNIWVIYLIFVYVYTNLYACMYMYILTLRFITELLSTALMALNSYYKHPISEIRVTTFRL